MGRLKSFATNHPLLFVFSSTIVWFILLVVFTGMTSSALQQPFGGPITVTIGRLALIACVLLLLWRVGWLESAGVARLGGWRVWLIALGGLIYFVSAALYSFYGEVAFDFASLIRSPVARRTILTNLTVVSSEEILFRGVVLYALVRVWGNSRKGLIESIFLTSLLFSVLHLTQVFTHEVSLASATLLTLETCIVSFWWGALVLRGGSIWPAVMLHFVVNAVLAVQGLSASMVEPEITAYKQILWFSLPLGVFGIALVEKELERSIVPEVP